MGEEAGPRGTFWQRAYWILERTILPGARFAPEWFEDVVGEHVAESTDWLDLGCGRHLLPPWRSRAEAELAAKPRRLVGVDVDLPSLRANRTIEYRIAAEAASLPFDDRSFDLVTANMVVEHLDRPTGQFLEVARVLRPGGAFVFRTPNLYGYTTIAARLLGEPLKKRLAWLLEGRREESVFPAHYRANSRRAIASLSREAEFELEHLHFVSSGPELRRLPPLALFELIWIRVVSSHPLRGLRNQIIAELRRTAQST